MEGGGGGAPGRGRRRAQLRRELPGVLVLGRAGHGAVRGVQAGGLRGGGGVEGVLLLGGGEGRVDGRRHLRAAGGRTGAEGGAAVAVVRQDAAGGRLRHAVRAAVGSVGRHEEVRPRRTHAHRQPSHRGADPRQDRPRATAAAPLALLVRLRLQGLPLLERRLPLLPPLRPRPSADHPEWRGDGGRGVHPRVHLVVGVLDGDGVPGVQRGGAGQVPDVRRGPAGLRPEPEAGGLPLHSPGARRDDRALRAAALPPPQVPRRRPFARLRPRARPRRQVPRRRQVPHPPRAPILPGAGGGGGGGDAVRDAAGGAAAGVAGDRVRGVDGVLVRARQPDHLPHHLQAPPHLGPPLQALHPQQDEDVSDRGVHVPHAQRGVAHAAQHHLRQREQDGQLPRRGRRAAGLRGRRLPRPRRRAPPRGMRARRRRQGAQGPRHRLRPQGPHHHHRRPGEALRRRARGHLAPERRRRRVAPSYHHTTLASAVHRSEDSAQERHEQIKQERNSDRLPAEI